MVDKKRFRVDFWEYERGWGSKVDFTEYFDTYEEADKRKQEFNSENITAGIPFQSPVPDWYMIAQGPYDTEKFR